MQDVLNGVIVRARGIRHQQRREDVKVQNRSSQLCETSSISWYNVEDLGEARLMISRSRLCERAELVAGRAAKQRWATSEVSMP